MSHRDHLVAACHHLADRGLSPGGSGNLSLRLAETLLITPTGSSCSRVQPDQLADAPITGAADPGPDSPRPSKELALHQAVYRVRPDVAAVVHLHSHFSVAASCLQPRLAALDATGPLPALTPYQVLRLGSLPVAPYAPPGSQALADQVAELLGEHSILLLANHGSLVGAADLDRAVDLAEELEAAARLAFTLAGVPHRRLGRAQVAQLRGR